MGGIALRRAPWNQKKMQKNKTPQREKVLSFEKKPIAKTGRECLLLCNQIAASMSKIYKYQLGADICRAGTQLAGAIYLALDNMGYSEQKISDIKKINEKLIELLVLVRVARDTNQVAAPNFELLISKIVSIKTQAENWLGFIEKGTDKANEDK